MSKKEKPIKPTKEWEEEMKNVLEDETQIFDWWSDEDEDTWLQKIGWNIYWKWSKVRDIWNNIKYFFQRKYRKSGCSDLDFWNLDRHLAEVLYIKIAAFKKRERMGFPGHIVKDEDFEGTDDEIHEHCAQKWENIIQQMLDELKAILDENTYYGLNMKQIKTLETKTVQYVFKEPKGSVLHTQDFDYDIKHPEYEYRGRQVMYQYEDSPQPDLRPHTLYKYFNNLWD